MVTNSFSKSYQSAGNADKANLLSGLKIDDSDRDSDTPVNNRGNGWRMSALALLVSGVAGAWLYTNSGDEKSLAETVVETRQVSQTQPVDQASLVTAIPDLSITAVSLLDATGYITARRQATVSSQITGKVVEVFAEEGDAVEKGQLLARLDNSVLMARYHLNESQLKAAETDLLELKVQAQEAQLNLKRMQQLTSRSLASQADLDQALLNLQAVQARTARAHQDIDVASNVLQLQEQQLAETEIRAPFTGIITNKAAQPGEVISPMSTITTGIYSMVDMDSLEIEVDVSESNINRVFAGQRVTATLNSYPDWQFAAEVITIIPTADRNKATVQVRIKILTHDQRILPDMGVRVSFLDEHTSLEKQTELSNQQTH